MTQLHDLLEELRLAAGLKKTEISRQIGMSDSYYRKLIETESKPGYDVLNKLARTLGVSYQRLADASGEAGEGSEPRLSIPVSGAPSAADHDLIAIRGTASGSALGFFALNDEPIDYVVRPAPLARVLDLYALYVTGDSMAPLHNHGDLRLVAPHQVIRPGDDVIVQMRTANGDTEAMIARYRGETATHYLLRKFNLGGKDANIEEKRSDVKRLHRVVTMNEILGK